MATIEQWRVLWLQHDDNNIPRLILFIQLIRSQKKIWRLSQLKSLSGNFLIFGKRISILWQPRIVYIEMSCHMQMRIVKTQTKINAKVQLHYEILFVLLFFCSCNRFLLASNHSLITVFYLNMISCSIIKSQPRSINIQLMLPLAFKNCSSNKTIAIWCLFTKIHFWTLWTLAIWKIFIL